MINCYMGSYLFGSLMVSIPGHARHVFEKPPYNAFLWAALVTREQSDLSGYSRFHGSFCRFAAILKSPVNQP